MLAGAAILGITGTSFSPAFADPPDHADFEVIDSATGKPVETGVGAARLAAPNGFEVQSPIRNNIGTYKVNLVDTPNVEQYRSTVDAVAVRLEGLGVAKLTVAQGVIPDRSGTVPTGEIDVRTTPLPACSGSRGSIGCAQAYVVLRADGSLTATSARVSLDVTADKYNAVGKTQLVFHEIGHALGLDHYDDLFEGSAQMMRSYASTATDYRSGDIAGLHYLSEHEKPRGALTLEANDEKTVIVTGRYIDPDNYLRYFPSPPHPTLVVDGKVASTSSSFEWVDDPDHPRENGFTFKLPTTPGNHTVCMDIVDFPSGETVRVACADVTVPDAPFPGFAQVTGTTGTTFGLDKSGRIFAWGYRYADDPGLLAVPGKTFVQIAAVRPASDPWINHYLALSSDGEVFGWGTGTSGELGPDLVDQDWGGIPVKVQGLDGRKFTQVATAGHASAAVASDGTVYTWGSNAQGLLGTGTTAGSVASPARIPGLEQVAQISGGSQHFLARTTSGDVYSWGGNYASQLGNGSTTYSPVPIRLTGLSGKGVSQVAAGANFSVAISSDGTAWSWGSNDYGQLGNGVSGGPRLTTPTISAELSGKGIVALSLGDYHGVALTTDRQVLAWGYNWDGQLGNGTHSVSVPIPAAISPVDGTPRFVMASTERSLVVLDDGRASQFGAVPRSVQYKFYDTWTPQLVVAPQ